MRYARADRLIQLALEMQAARGGLTLTDIETRFEVSRRTAIRMRDAVLRVFPQADEVPSNDRSKRWRLSTPATRPLLGITADDLATIEDQLTTVLEEDGLGEFDGNETGPTETTLFMYGPDAERLFAGIEDTLRAYPLCKGARVVIRRGEPGAEERTLTL